jgi:O-antigen ligase
MLLMFSSLLMGPASFRNAFSNKIFLAFLIFCVVEAAGYLHTHDLIEQQKIVFKEATLVAVVFAFTSGSRLNECYYRLLLLSYYLMLVAACVYCLVLAFAEYSQRKDPSVFFYHLLTRPISHNAVFFAVYIVFGLLLVLSPGGLAAPADTPKKGWKALRIFLVLFFLGMIVLLNSKLILVVGLLIVLHSFFRKYSLRKNKRLVMTVSSVVLLLIVLTAVTRNPVSDRYRDMATGDIEVVRQPVFHPSMYFNPLQLRLLEWRFGWEILNARQAWLFGVSPGDAQDLLDQKYIATNMYIGNPADGPHRKVRGFIGYNFHDQYLQTMVQSGIAGLIALLFLFASLFAAARKSGKREGWFVILILAIFFIPEAPLTLQHGVFLLCFFPLLLLYSPREEANFSSTNQKT